VPLATGEYAPWRVAIVVNLRTRVGLVFCCPSVPFRSKVLRSRWMEISPQHVRCKIYTLKQTPNTITSVPFRSKVGRSRWVETSPQQICWNIYIYFETNPKSNHELKYIKHERLRQVQRGAVPPNEQGLAASDHGNQGPGTKRY